MFRWLAEVFFSRRLIRLIPGGWLLVLLTSPPLRFVSRRLYARVRRRLDERRAASRDAAWGPPARAAPAPAWEQPGGASRDLTP